MAQPVQAPGMLHQFDWETDHWRRTLTITTLAKQAVQGLAAGTNYRWRVRARQGDMYGDYHDNESRSDWEEFSTL